MAAGGEHGSMPVCSAHGSNGDRMPIWPLPCFARFPACSLVSPVFVAVGNRISVARVARGEEL